MPAPRKRLHDHVYAAGGARDPAELYIAFRGRLPTPEALLKRRGLSEKPLSRRHDRGSIASPVPSHCRA